MSTVASMLDTYPKSFDRIDTAKLTACIEACIECAQVCTACADACLSEDAAAELVKCIRIDLDCADICETAGRVLTPHRLRRQPHPVRPRYLCGGVQGVRRRVCSARLPSRTLPHVCRGVPTV